MGETSARTHVVEAGGEGPLLVIHGGAGRRLHEMTAAQKAETDEALARALEAGYAVLEQGGPAEDAVIAAIHVMEDAPCFNCGRGAALTLEGRAELDAALMLGDGNVGAACGLTTAKHPIDVARAVMERTPHVLFSEPAAELLDEWGIEQVENDYFVTPARLAALEEWKSLHETGDDHPETRHGTVGAVARDVRGHIAAGTSTGGITGQQPGRVGDSPLCGAGTYANGQTVAVSCTGTGETFIQEVAAYQVHARVSMAGEALPDAAAAMLAGVDARGGNGGVIVVPASGAGVVGFTDGAQMNYGWAHGVTRVTHE